MTLRDLIERFYSSGEAVVPDIVTDILSAAGPWPAHADKKREIMQAMHDSSHDFKLTKSKITSLQRVRSLYQTFLTYSENDVINTPEKVRVTTHELIEHLQQEPQDHQILDSLNMVKLFCSLAIHGKQFYKTKQESDENIFRNSPREIDRKMKAFFGVDIKSEKVWSETYLDNFQLAKKLVDRSLRSVNQNLQEIRRIQVSMQGEKLRKRQQLKSLLKCHLLLNPDREDERWMNALYYVPSVNQYSCSVQPSLSDCVDENSQTDYEFSSTHGFSSIGHSAIYSDKKFPCVDAISGLVNSHAMCSYMLTDLEGRDVNLLRDISRRLVRNASLIMQSARVGMAGVQDRLPDILRDCLADANSYRENISDNICVALCRKFISRDGTIRVVSAVNRSAIIAYSPGDSKIIVCASPKHGTQQQISEDYKVNISNVIIPSNGHLIQLSNQAWKLIEADDGQSLVAYLQKCKGPVALNIKLYFDDHFNKNKQEWLSLSKSILIARETCLGRISHETTIHEFCDLNPNIKSKVLRVLALFGETDLEVLIRTKSLVWFLTHCILSDIENISGYVTVNAAETNYIEANHALFVDEFLPSIYSSQVTESQRHHIYWDWSSKLKAELKKLYAECSANKKTRWTIKRSDCQYRILEKHLKDIEAKLPATADRAANPQKAFDETREIILSQWRAIVSPYSVDELDRFLSMHLSRLFFFMGQCDNLFYGSVKDIIPVGHRLDAESRVILELIFRRWFTGEDNQHEIDSLLQRLKIMWPNNFILNCYHAATKMAPLPPSKNHGLSELIAKGIYYYVQFCQNQKSEYFDTGMLLLNADESGHPIIRHMKVLFQLVKGVAKEDVGNIVNELYEVMDVHPEAYITLCKFITREPESESFLKNYFSKSHDLSPILHKIVFLLDCKCKLHERDVYCKAFDYRKNMFDEMDNIIAAEFDKLIDCCERGVQGASPQHIMAYTEYFWYKYHSVNVILPLLEYCIAIGQPAAWAICAEIACECGQPQFLRAFARVIVESDLEYGAREYALACFGQLLHQRGNSKPNYYQHYVNALEADYLSAELRKIVVNDETFQIEVAPNGLPGLEEIPAKPAVLMIEDDSDWRDQDSNSRLSSRDVFMPLMRNRPLSFLSSPTAARVAAVGLNNSSVATSESARVLKTN